ncbi:MAG TPA: hypothetical protein VNS58_00980 [Puia sp.]|nr:hypothetical protein [Puia sp.]
MRLLRDGHRPPDTSTIETLIQQRRFLLTEVFREEHPPNHAVSKRPAVHLAKGAFLRIATSTTNEFERRTSAVARMAARPPMQRLIPMIKKQAPGVNSVLSQVS